MKGVCNMRNFQAVTSKAFPLVLAACFVFVFQSYAQTPAPASSAASAPKPVLVELFTAEGCSDCPPAEAIAVKMEKQPLTGIDLIVLEEHVDYWNQYGWNDAYSSMEWTERQREYVSKLADKSPYTPEMVVDGESQFVGSNGRAAQQAIEKAAQGPQTSVAISKGGSDPKDSADFSVSVGNLQGNTPKDTAEVWVAITEDGLHSSVSAGENAGHTLYHAAVLRSLQKIGTARPNSGATSFTGDAHLKLKSNWNRENLNVVVFVQEKKSRKILGAASAKLAA